MQRRRQLAMAHLQQHLGQAGDAGRAFAMADVRLGRADRAKLALLRIPSKRLRQPADLDRIAQRGAGAVRLDIADAARMHAGAPQRVADKLGLRQRIGHRVAIGLAAGVEHATLDDAVDLVAGGDRRLQRLEHHRAHAFAVDEAVGVGAERFAGVAGRQHRHRGQADVMAGIEYQVDAAGDRAGATTAAQTLQRQVQRRQRRRASGVDRDAGAVEVEQVGDPVGDRPIARAAHVVFVHHADKDAHGAILGQAGRRIAGVLDAAVGFFQEQPLLRTHFFRLVRGNIEEQRVETIGAVDEAAPFAIGFAGLSLVGVKVQGRVPARGGHLGDAVGPRLQVRPELLDVFRAGITAGQANDGDLLRPGRERNRRGRRRGGAGRRRRRARRLGARRHGRLVQSQPCRQGHRLVFDKMGDQRIDGQAFEKQRAADIGEDLAQGVGQLHDENRIDAVLRQLRAGVDLVQRHAQGIADQFLEARHGACREARVGAGRQRGAGGGRRGAGGRRRCRRGAGAHLGPHLPHHAVAGGGNHLLAQAVAAPRREGDIAKAFLLQHRLPTLRRQGRASRHAQGGVLVQPPAFEQAERQVGEQIGAVDLV